MRKGSHASEETRMKLRISHLGKKQSKEQIEKLKNRLKGHKTSEETKQKISNSMRGEKCYNWKGGIASDGYGRISVNIGKRVKIHRHIMEKIIGRPLTEREIVHHINGNKLDNRPENLQILSGKSEHARLHAKLRKT